MLWARMLATSPERLIKSFCCGTILRAENRILRGQIKGRLLLWEGEKATLAEIAHRLGREALGNCK